MSDLGMCRCGCLCDKEATCTDEGVPVCDTCRIYLVDEDGDVVCAIETQGFTVCHLCLENISWGGIITDDNSGNYRLGECGCGLRWRNEEEGGGWERYRC